MKRSNARACVSDVLVEASDDATRRAEAHVVHPAALYATHDRSPAIALPHLEAALAVWHYSLDSARWIFGDSLGNPAADEIRALAEDRRHGVARTEVRDEVRLDHAPR